MLLTDDLIAETTVTTGTGTVSLAGAQTGYQRFRDFYADGDRVGYAIFVPGGAHERGIGRLIYGSPDTLTRDVVLVSSNGDTGLVNFAAGTKQAIGSFQTGVGAEIGPIGLCHVHRNGTDQTGLANATWHQVDYTTKGVDHQNWFNLTTDRYVPKLPGWYQVSILAMFDGTNIGEGDLLRQRVLRNGSTADTAPGGQSNVRQSGTGSIGTMPITTLIDMDGVDDYLEHEVRVDGAAGNVLLAGNRQFTQFNARYAGPL